MRRLTAVMLLTLTIICILSACSEKNELKALEITDDIMDISAMGMSTEEFLNAYGKMIASSETRTANDDQTTVTYYERILSDDENHKMSVSYCIDNGVDKVEGISVSAYIGKDNGKHTQEEYLNIYNKSLDNCIDVLKSKFSLTTEPEGFRTDDVTLLSWSTDEYTYDLTGTYKADKETSEDICYITIHIISHEHINRYPK